MPKFVIFSDGSSKGNPGPGGWGAIIADERTVRELGGAEERTTNNRMELRAALEALSYLSKAEEKALIIFRTDSSYVIKGAQFWGKNWERNGWKTATKKDVLSRDLWEPFLSLVKQFGADITWEHVGGHVGIPGNERVDEIAQSYADGEPPLLYSGSRDAYAIDLDSIATSTEKSASRSRSRATAYSYVSEVDGVVKVHTTWEECKRAVHGKRARFRKTASPEDEAKTIREYSA